MRRSPESRGPGALSDLSFKVDERELFEDAHGASRPLTLLPAEAEPGGPRRAEIMTSHRYASRPVPNPSVTEAALAALDAGELRGLVREILPWLDESTHVRLVNALVDRAARNRSGWVPAGPSRGAVDAIVSYAEAAKRVGYAEPSTVDDYLRQGSNAFLGKDYPSALQIFRALLIPIGSADIDLGQHEMIDEVLGVDVAACATQYVISTYMTAPPPKRGTAVRSAIDEMLAIGSFWTPLEEMERVAVEPLPELSEFLVEWRALVAERVAQERASDWDSHGDRWLREVVARMEGADGLRKLARATKRAEDLHAWCDALVEARDWKAALRACEESADLVAGKEYERGLFLDGAALAAQELGRDDLPKRLERAWRGAPDMARLRRWLGTCKSKAALRRRAAAALGACPKQAHRQRALLHLLLDELPSAAKLLASAPGLGLSSPEHPGHLLFPFFCSRLGGIELPAEPPDIDEWRLPSERDEPRLATAEVEELLQLADGRAIDAERRDAVLRAMRVAAEKRIKGVVENKRRRHYAHAATLALACAEIDHTSGSAAWLAAIREEYRRYPALQHELRGRGG